MSKTKTEWNKNYVRSRMVCKFKLLTSLDNVRESIDSTLTAYNNSCAEMRSEARDAYICMKQDMLT